MVWLIFIMLDVSNVTATGRWSDMSLYIIAASYEFQTVSIKILSNKVAELFDMRVGLCMVGNIY